MLCSDILTKSLSGQNKHFQKVDPRLWHIHSKSVWFGKMYSFWNVLTSVRVERVSLQQQPSRVQPTASTEEDGMASVMLCIMQNPAVSWRKKEKSLLSYLEQNWSEQSGTLGCVSATVAAAAAGVALRHSNRCFTENTRGTCWDALKVSVVL